MFTSAHSGDSNTKTEFSSQVNIGEIFVERGWVYGARTMYVHYNILAHNLIVTMLQGEEMELPSLTREQEARIIAQQILDDVVARIPPSIQSSPIKTLSVPSEGVDSDSSEVFGTPERDTAVVSSPYHTCSSIPEEAGTSQGEGGEPEESDSGSANLVENSDAQEVMSEVLQEPTEPSQPEEEHKFLGSGVSDTTSLNFEEAPRCPENEVNSDQKAMF